MNMILFYEFKDKFFNPYFSVMLTYLTYLNHLIKTVYINKITHR